MLLVDASHAIAEDDRDLVQARQCVANGLSAREGHVGRFLMVMEGVTFGSQTAVLL